MEHKILKSQIQANYKSLLSEGHEDWDARAILINSFINDVEETEEFTEVGTPEYFFTIKTIWDLCSI